MFTNEWIGLFIQSLVLIPSAISCYLPAKNQMKSTTQKTLALICAVILPLAFAAASVSTIFRININLVILPAMIAMFFLYRLTVKFDLSRSLAVYVGVCAIQTFPSHFATIFDMYVSNEAETLTVGASLVNLGLSCALTAAFVYPARNLFSKAVDEPGLSKIWFMTVPISFVFLIFNIFAMPASYDVVRESRLIFLYPAFEVFGLIVLISIYVLFYRGAIILIERARLEKRSILMEMQARQFRELQEYVKQTGRLRHDFRQSVRLLAGLAEKGDTESIRAYLSEYEQRFSESSAVNYSANAALNALFAYYHSIAESEEIKVDWHIELPEPLTVSELDMAALFGNLMENAIDACSAISKERRYFNLTTEIRANELYIVSTNSFDGKTLKSGSEYRSTKRGGTGTGLMSIAAVAEKHGGTMRAYNSEGEFFVDVVMKI
ncbi:MAG: GHKL domain-containing protein [Bacteroides sp.]|nr:GHKL domain-containing protein [Eubacterium sp.]MCM1417373.1 GHKL domain-containing protein [Roseburia sp.]MCM1461435.1 GHKL domain-containing protein [Bacteroides sp.]